MKKMLTLAVLAALASTQAYSLPTTRLMPPLPKPEIRKVASGSLDGWEIHLKTDTELAVCVNPVVLAKLHVIKCDGIKTLTLLSELPGAQED